MPVDPVTHATPFNGALIPCQYFDVESLEAAATSLKARASDLRAAGESIKGEWAGMPACYTAPEQEALYAAMDPVANSTDALASDYETIASALTTFAGAAASLKERAQALKADVVAFYEAVKSVGTDKWDQDEDLVNQNNSFIDRASAIQADLWAAERDCANTIRALDGLDPYHVGSANGGDDDLAYGMSADEMAGAGELPWGEKVDRHEGCAKESLDWAGRFVWDGLTKEGLLGAVNGGLALAGVEIFGENGAFDVNGMRSIMALQALAGLVGLSWNDDMSFNGASWSTAGNAWRELGKGLVAWDMWSEDSARAAGSVVFNIGTIYLTKGASAGARVPGAGRAARLARGAAQVAAIADRALAFMDLAGTAMGAAAGRGVRVLARVADLSGLTAALRRIRNWIDSRGAGAHGTELDVTTDVPDAGGWHSRSPDAEGSTSGSHVDSGDGSQPRGGHGDSADSATGRAADRSGHDGGDSTGDSTGRAGREGDSADADGTARGATEGDGSAGAGRDGRADGEAGSDAHAAGHHRGDGEDGADSSASEAGARGRHAADDADASGSGCGDGADGSGDGRGHADGDVRSGSDADGGTRGDGADGRAGDGSGRDGSDSQPSAEELLERRRQQADADPFNQEHRPRTDRTVEVEEGSALLPRKDRPFGRGVELEPNTCYHVEKRGNFYTDDAGEVVHVEAHSAVERRGWWDIPRPLNPDLRDPLPNATYTVDGRYHYTTDEWGRTVRLQVDRMPKSLEQYRSDDSQAKIGKKGGDDYQGGHLAGNQFGGGPEEINVVPMLKKVNLSDYRKLENQIAADPDAYQGLDITIEYGGPPGVPSGSSLSGVPDAHRVPTRFEVSWVNEEGVRTEPVPFENRKSRQ